MLFTGEYEHTIDAKQRLAIPADVRAILDPDRDPDEIPRKGSGAVRDRRVRHRARPNPRHLVGAKLVVTQSQVKKISLLPGLSFNVLVAVAGHRANSVNHVKS